MKSNTKELQLESEITAREAVTIISKKLPEYGITVRDFLTLSCKLRGDNDDIIQEAIRLAELEGINPNAIVTLGKNGTKLH